MTQPPSMGYAVGDISPLAGNTNRAVHFARSDRGGLVLPSLGRRYGSILNLLKYYRRALESQCRHIQVSERLRATREISAAVGYERTRLLAVKAITDSPDAPGAEHVHLSKTANWAERERNAAIARLGIDPTAGADGDPWQALDQQRLTENNAPRAAQTPVPANPADGPDAALPSDLSPDATPEPPSGQGEADSC